MKQGTWVFALAMFVCGQLMATEILWLKLTPNFSYRDINTACSTGAFPGGRDLYFAAEVEGNKVTRAAIKDNLSDILSSRIEFLPPEISAIALYRDSMGRLWLEQLPLSVRLLNWVFFHVSSYSEGCRPPQRLATISPAPFSFSFDMDGLGEGSLVSHSTAGKFIGKRWDGAAYEAELRFAETIFRALK